MKCETVKFPVPLLQTNVLLVLFSLFEALDESLSFAMNGSLIKSAMHAFRDGDISSNFNTLCTVTTKFSNLPSFSPILFFQLDFVELLWSLFLRRLQSSDLEAISVMVLGL